MSGHKCSHIPGIQVKLRVEFCSTRLLANSRYRCGHFPVCHTPTPGLLVEMVEDIPELGEMAGAPRLVRELRRGLARQLGMRKKAERTQPIRDGDNDHTLVCELVAPVQRH
jgi:hypothetical protein